MYQYFKQRMHNKVYSLGVFGCLVFFWCFSICFDGIVSSDLIAMVIMISGHHNLHTLSLRSPPHSRTSSINGDQKEEEEEDGYDHYLGM